MTEETVMFTLSGQRTPMSSILRPLNASVVVSEEAVLRLEYQPFLNVPDKVALIFLLYQDSKLAYSKITELLSKKPVDIFRGLKESTHNWKLKVMESLSLMKHYRAIRYVGLDKSDVILNSKDESVRLNERGSMYSLCEQLTVEETKQFIEEMDKSGFPCMMDFDRVFLEHHFLHWIVSGLAIGVILDSIRKFLVAIKKDYILKDSCSFGSALSKNLLIIPPVRIQYQPEEAYPIINSCNVGLCIIINEIDYHSVEHGRRTGSEKDAETMRETMEELKFEVVTLKNLGGHRMLVELKECILEQFSDTHSILMMVVMAHGFDGKIIGVDNVDINIQDIADVTTTCKRLNKKAKILVVQACQGDRHFQCIERDGTPSRSPRLYGTRSATDIIICMSTISGFASYRDRDEGSFYIQNLCQMIKKHSHDEICKILQRVNQSFTSPILQGGVGLQPEFRSRLRKDLYLAPSPIDDESDSTTQASSVA